MGVVDLLIKSVPLIMHPIAGTGKLGQMGGMSADVIGLDWSTEIGEARRLLGPDVRCAFNQVSTNLHITGMI